MYSRPSPRDFEYESDYIEALEAWQDRQENYTCDELFEAERDSRLDDESQDS